MELSADQARARDRIAALLRAAGVDLDAGALLPGGGGPQAALAVTGKAGSGKTMLLAALVRAMIAAGVEPVSADYESRRARARRTLAVLAPTNKAASVLRARGVPATTIHRILYTPLYHPEYEAIAEWLTGKARRPKVDGLSEAALDRAKAFFDAHPSIPGALATAGLRSSDFIKGWKRRDEPLDIGFVDEASMLDERQFVDLRAIFRTLVLFGDPAQLAPVGGGGGMVFESLPEQARLELHRVHRQAADNPILDLAHALGDPALSFAGFEGLVRQAAGRDGRVVVAPRAAAGPMARAPVLVWRNATRVRLIHAFRTAHGAPEDALLPGEPLVCDGIELPVKHRRKRMDLEARGLIKGTQAVYLGPGRTPGLRAAAPLRGGGAAARRRRDHRARDAGARGAAHRVGGEHGSGVPARGGGDDPQGAGLAVAGGAGLRARPLGGGAVRADRGGRGALAAARLRRDHPGGGAADLGDPIRPRPSDRAARHR